MGANLSILIPTYNYNAFPLVEALMAEINRLNQDIEILVFEDGSSEVHEDHKRINDYPKAQYRYFEENRGRSSIRMALAENAKSEWLLFLDSDVMPASEDFLKDYIAKMNGDHAVVFGGYSYPEHYDNAGNMLRYHYGRDRESLKPTERSHRPHLVFAGNLLIRKNSFLQITKGIPDFYGEDLVLSDRIRNEKLTVLHIDNPIVHLGLEPSERYLAKVKEMATQIAKLEKKGMLSDDLMTLQTKYQWLRKRGMLGALLWYVRTFENGIEKNLMSSEPNLRNLDLIKLYYYHQALKDG